MELSLDAVNAMRDWYSRGTPASVWIVLAPLLGFRISYESDFT